MRHVYQRFGANYLWGLLNFTAGCILCGVYVAAILIGHGILK